MSKIAILCSDRTHPVYAFLADWIEKQNDDRFDLISSVEELPGGDLLFLVSCTQIVRAEDLARYRRAFVLHASDLPRGRGWSPHVWTILSGGNKITLSLIEAAKEIDRGRIWAQREIQLAGHELYDEINERLFTAEMELIAELVENEGGIVPKEQSEEEATYFRKRTPLDSKIDPDRSIAEQFNLLRVCDYERFPAFFDLHGHRYFLKIKKERDQLQKD
jgi:methionyl-tRNA formyltransferase